MADNEPFSALGETALKVARFVLLGFAMPCAALNPTLGFLVCVAYLSLAWWLSGSAFQAQLGRGLVRGGTGRPSPEAAG